MKNVAIWLVKKGLEILGLVLIVGLVVIIFGIMIFAMAVYEVIGTAYYELRDGSCHPYQFY